MLFGEWKRGKRTGHDFGFLCHFWRPKFQQKSCKFCPRCWRTIFLAGNHNAHACVFLYVHISKYSYLEHARCKPNSFQIRKRMVNKVHGTGGSRAWPPILVENQHFLFLPLFYQKVIKTFKVMCSALSGVIIDRLLNWLCVQTRNDFREINFVIFNFSTDRLFFLIWDSTAYGGCFFL